MSYTDTDVTKLILNLLTKAQFDTSSKSPLELWFTTDEGFLPDTTKFGAGLSMSVDPSTYVLTLQLKDQDGNALGTAQTVDLPIESLILSVTYDDTNKRLVITLQNGNVVYVPLGDLVSGLQTEITPSNKLDADLVNDSTSTNKFVTATEKNSIANAVQKTGDTMTGLLVVPRLKTPYLEAYGDSSHLTTITYGSVDIVNRVITYGMNMGSWKTVLYGDSLKYKVNGIEYDIATTSDLATKQDTLVSGTNIKTINGSSILGSGDLVIQTGGTYTAGTGIIIQNDEISVDGETVDELDTETIQELDTETTQELDTEAVNEISLAAVATSGAYNDLSGTPTDFTGADGTNAGTAGLVPAPAATDNDKFLKGDGTWGTPSGGGNFVTTDTAQNITAKKTFVGEKAIYFKQSAAADKLGFTLFDGSDAELAAFEYRPNTIGGNPLLNINASQSGNIWLGFRYWANINIVAPKPANGTYYIPVNITNGTTTVTANSAGTVDISTLLPTVPTIATSVSSASTNSETVGAKLFYDTCGDIETLINAL